MNNPIPETHQEFMKNILGLLSVKIMTRVVMKLHLSRKRG